MKLSQKMARLGTEGAFKVLMKASPALYDELRKLPVEVVPVGDVVEARKVINAVHEGYHAGRRV